MLLVASCNGNRKKNNITLHAMADSSLICFCFCFSFQYPFHADSHKRDTKNLIQVVINTLEAQDHVCKGPREGFPKRASVASLFGESFSVGPGDASIRSGNKTWLKIKFSRMESIFLY